MISADQLVSTSSLRSVFFFKIVEKTFTKTSSYISSSKVKTSSFLHWYLSLSLFVALKKLNLMFHGLRLSRRTKLYGTADECRKEITTIAWKIFRAIDKLFQNFLNTHFRLTRLSFVSVKDHISEAHAFSLTFIFTVPAENKKSRINLGFLFCWPKNYRTERA